MAIKFLSGLNLSNVTAGSILKLDSNGNIVAAVSGTDYNTGSADSWSDVSSDIYRNSDVRIGTYQSGVAPAARLHVFDYQTTDPKLLIEDGNTGDASMEFKISTQSYTMGIDNSDSDKFVIAASTALGTTNALEVATTGSAAFQNGLLVNGGFYVNANSTNGISFTDDGTFTAINADAVLRINQRVEVWGGGSGKQYLDVRDQSGNVKVMLNAEDNSYFTNGNVGIGTSNPGYPLDISNNSTRFSFSTSSGNAILYMDGANGDLSGGDYTSITSDSSGNFYIGTGNSERFRIEHGGNVGIGTDNPSSSLHIYKSSGTTTSSTGTTLLTLENYVGSDLKHQKSFIDFVLKDDNTNETPQVRIGAEVGNNDLDASTQAEEGMGAFVVYTNNADTNSGAAGTSLAERFRVDRNGRVGIGTNNPAQKLHVAGDIYTTSDFLGNSIISADAALTISNTGIQPDQGDVEDIVAFNYATTKVAHIDTDGYIHATGFKTSGTTGFLKSDGTVATGSFFSGAYNDLSGKPTLGTMAAAATSDYKTSDQTETYVAGELASYTATTGFGTNAFTSFSDHSTQGYLTALPSHNHDDRYYTETELNGFFKSVTHQGNYISTANWSNDGSGTVAAGWSAEGYPFSPTGGFNQNGETAENTRTVAELPNGAYGVVWRTPSNDASSSSDGGWDMDINNVQHAKAYRSVVYFQKTDDSTSGTFYHGCHGSHTLGMNGSANTNPYFHTLGFSNLVENRWYVSIGYIQPYQYPTGTDSTRSGIYDCYTGKKIHGGQDFMMKSGSTTQRHRTYQYYSTDTSSSINWWCPRFEETNGNEPSLAELIQRVGIDGELGLNFHSKFPAGALDSLSETTDATNDKILLWDESADVWKQMTLEDLQDSIDTDTTNFATAAQGTTADAALPKAGGTVTGNLRLDSSFKWATTNANSYTYSNADSSGLYIETVGNTDALSDMRFQARASGAGNYSSIAIKPSNQSIVLRTNGTNALVLDTSQNATLAGKLYIGSTDATTTATTALLLGAAGEVKKRGLGSNAFTSTTIPTGTASSKAVTDFIQDFGTSATSDINTIGNASGKYRWNNTTTGRPASSQANEYGTLLNLHYSGNETTQIAHDIAQANLWIRSLNTESDTGTAWKQIADTAYVSAAVAGIVDSAPAALDTLNELAAALGDDASFSTTMSTALGNRLRIDVNNQSLSSTELANARTNLGLGTAATAASTAFVAVSGDTMTGALKLPSQWSSTNLDANSFYVQNATDGFAFGIGTDISSWFSWDSSVGQKRAIDVWNNGSKILLGAGGADTEIQNNLYVPNHIFHTGDTDTYMQFHAANQWRVVTGGAERLEVNDTQVSVSNNLVVTGTVGASNLSGTNTGDQTLSSLGALSTSGGNLTGNLGINSSSPAAPLDVQPASDYKVTKVGVDRTSQYRLQGLADHTLTLACTSYHSAEVVITAHQTNGGTNNNLYIRGIWTNNHTSHHWHEIENIGGLSGSSFTITNGQSGDTTNSGELEIVHDYSSGSFAQMVVRVTDHYGTHSYTIS